MKLPPNQGMQGPRKVLAVSRKVGATSPLGVGLLTIGSKFLPRSRASAPSDHRKRRPRGDSLLPIGGIRSPVLAPSRQPDTPFPSAPAKTRRKRVEGRACLRDQGGPTASSATNGSRGGNEPRGNRASRSPALRRSVG